MCVIIAKPKGSTVSLDTLNDCWLYNPDGAGVTWCEDGQLHLRKGFMSWEHFRYFWNSKDWENVPAIIHFRIATSGNVNKKNTHPFWVVNSSVTFAHNGIFSGLGKEKISDTIVFNRNVLQNLPKDFLDNEILVDMIDKYCGYGSKLAFLRDTGEITIIGKSRGVKGKDGCWYSNDNHRFTWHKGRNGQWFKNESEDLLSPWDDDQDEEFDNDIWYEKKYEDLEYYNVAGDPLLMSDVVAPFSDTDELISILGCNEWWCHSCDHGFEAKEVGGLAVERDGLVLPVCPACESSDHVYCYEEE